MVKVGEIYKLKDHDGRVRILNIMGNEGVVGIMAETVDDIPLPDPYGQYTGKSVVRGAIIGITLQELVFNGDNADFEPLLRSMDEVT